MASDGNDFVVQYRAIVEGRVAEQIARHQKIDPSIDPRKIVSIQIQQEKEHLERLIEAQDTKPAEAELLQLMVAWLPELERKLKGR